MFFIDASQLKTGFFQSITGLPVLILLSACSFDEVNPEIYGEWYGNHEDQEIVFVFDENSEVKIFTIKDDGDTSLIVSGTFTTDQSKKPNLLSINGINEMNHGLYSIVKFIHRDSIVIASFSPKWRLRPINFDERKVYRLAR